MSSALFNLEQNGNIYDIYCTSKIDLTIKGATKIGDGCTLNFVFSAIWMPLVHLRMQ